MMQYIFKDSSFISPSCNKGVQALCLYNSVLGLWSGHGENPSKLHYTRLLSAFILFHLFPDSIYLDPSQVGGDHNLNSNCLELPKPFFSEPIPAKMMWIQILLIFE